MRETNKLNGFASEAVNGKGCENVAGERGNHKDEQGVQHIGWQRRFGTEQLDDKRRRNGRTIIRDIEQEPATSRANQAR